MSEQDITQSAAKQPRIRKTNTTNQQNGKQAPAAQYPGNHDKEAWKEYWKAQGQPWRTEPQIDAERQQFLAERLSITSNIERGIYPFKGIRLNRADVEWLLATHENGQGPVDWNEMPQRGRIGLDLRGADLHSIDLQYLPLTHMYGGLIWAEWIVATDEQREVAAVHLEAANLYGAHLEAARLRGAHLEGARLRDAYLEAASLYRAHLEGADLFRARLEGASLREAFLGGKKMAASLEQDCPPDKYLPTTLPPANLQLAIFDHTTSLDHIAFGDEVYGFAFLVDVRWNGVNLAVVDWTSVKMLGDEFVAHKRTTLQEGTKDKTMQLEEYRVAVRANRQMAAALRDQGLNEEADYFAYRAQLLQRGVWRRQQRILKYALSWFLYMIAGYGYRPLRSLFWYLFIIIGFAIAYSISGHLSLFPPDAFVYSLTSFHGRGFFPGLEHRTSLHDPLIMFAAIEAVIGLFIEISFIATFTQRFFGK